MSAPADDDAIAARLRDLHTRTDRRFWASVAAIGAPIRCGPRCSACCADDLRVWRPEAERIRAHVLRRRLAPSVHLAGACAFLGRDGTCQVYDARPYVCRSQGAVLRFFDPRQRRVTCAEHLAAIDLRTLPEQALFDLGPAEVELLELATADLACRDLRGLPERITLRELADELAAGRT